MRDSGSASRIARVQMALELGLNPKKFGKLAYHARG
jgi:hypothetical protein